MPTLYSFVFESGRKSYTFPNSFRHLVPILFSAPRFWRTVNLISLPLFLSTGIGPMKIQRLPSAYIEQHIFRVGCDCIFTFDTRLARHHWNTQVINITFRTN
jgi:hypothetical protein